MKVKAILYILTVVLFLALAVILGEQSKDHLGAAIVVGAIFTVPIAVIVMLLIGITIRGGIHFHFHVDRKAKEKETTVTVIDVTRESGQSMLSSGTAVTRR